MNPVEMMIPIEQIWAEIQGGAVVVQSPLNAHYNALEEMIWRFFKRLDQALAKKDQIVLRINEEPQYTILSGIGNEKRQCDNCHKKMRLDVWVREQMETVDKRKKRDLCPACFVKIGLKAGIEQETYAFTHWHSDAQKMVHSDIIGAVSPNAEVVWDGRSPAHLDIDTVITHVQTLNSGNIQLPHVHWAIQEAVGRYYVQLGASPIRPPYTWVEVRREWGCSRCGRTIQRLSIVYDGPMPFETLSGRYCTTCLASAFQGRKIDLNGLPVFMVDTWDFLNNTEVYSHDGAHHQAIANILVKICRGCG